MGSKEYLIHLEMNGEIFIKNDCDDKAQSLFEYRTRAIISACLKISMARKFSKISMPKTFKPYFLDIIVDAKA